MTLELHELFKKYSKMRTGLSNFSLTIENGILGLLGPNGAGKSTLMKLIATISRPTSGSIKLDGHDVNKDPDYIRKMLGFLPQDFGVYDNLNAYEFLAYIAALKGVGGPGLHNKIYDLLDSVNLIEAATRQLGTYSGGMKQRIGIAQALLNDPAVLIFDEPTVGLDPEERMRFRSLISDLGQKSIIILSSHIVSDIESIAGKVAIMKSGQLVTEGTQSAIISKVQGKVYLLNIDESHIVQFKASYLVAGTTRVNNEVLVRYISDTPAPASIPVEATLEDAYLFLTHKPIYETA